MKDLFKIWPRDLYEKLQSTVIDVLYYAQVIQEVQIGDNMIFLIPCLLDKFPPKKFVKEEWFLEGIETNEEKIYSYQRRYKFEYLPYSFFLQLIVRVIIMSTSIVSLWKKGMIFEIAEGKDKHVLSIRFMTKSEIEREEMEKTGNTEELDYEEYGDISLIICVKTTDATGKVLYKMSTIIEGTFYFLFFIIYFLLFIFYFLLFYIYIFIYF